MLKIALTKGRLERDAAGMLEKAGYDCAGLRNPGRRLLLELPPAEGGESRLSAVLAKAPDVITYVERGVCDLGVVGKDTILELGSSFYEVLDLGFGRCRFVLAARPGMDFNQASYKTRVIGTKYPQVTRSYFAKRGMEVDIVKIEGSVELAPLLGLADGIVDLTETGSTLRENGLVVLEEILPVSARLIVNLASMKLKKTDILTFIRGVEAAIQDGGQ